MKKFLLITVITLIPFNVNAQNHDPETTCMIDNAFSEARGEGVEGVKAVLEVVHNRQAKKPSMSLCDVIYKPYAFSWTIGRDGKGINYDGLSTRQKASYNMVIGVVADFYRNKIISVNGATHYYKFKGNGKVNPFWGACMYNIIEIGKHRFGKVYNKEKCEKLGLYN